MAISLDGRQAIAGLGNGELQRLDLVSGKLIGKPFQIDEGEIKAVAFSPDGKYIVSAGLKASKKMAKKRSKAKDWPGAVIHLRHNLALADAAADRGERLEFLADAYFKAERRAEAISASREAIAAGFESARLCANLGRALHLESGCLNESEQHLRRSLDLNPDNNPWAWSWLGLVLADQGSLDDAENHARRALVGHEQHAVLIHNLALVLVRHPDERADKLEEALHCCEQAEKFANFPFPYPTQLAVTLRQRLQSLGTPQNPSA
jgi:tetratricopeptide (TPR) repeat protein